LSYCNKAKEKRIIEEMDASLKQYVIGYIAIVTPIALSILFMRRGSNSPVQLRMKDGPVNAGAKMATTEPNRKPARDEANSTANAEKSLNAFFNWNGHLWDAYEALGIPAGSSIESVHSAYQRATAGADDNTKLFFKAALEAATHPSPKLKADPK
jgi:hypothetical protein